MIVREIRSRTRGRGQIPGPKYYGSLRHNAKDG